MTAGCTHPTCAHGATSKESRSGPGWLEHRSSVIVILSIPLGTDFSVASPFNTLYFQQQNISSACVKTAICHHQSLNPICPPPVSPSVSPWCRRGKNSIHLVSIEYKWVIRNSVGYVICVVFTMDDNFIFRNVTDNDIWCQAANKCDASRGAYVSAVL